MPVLYSSSRAPSSTSTHPGPRREAKSPKTSPSDRAACYPGAVLGDQVARRLPWAPVAVVLLTGCATAPSTAMRHEAAAGVVAALQATKFDEAAHQAEQVLHGDEGNPEAHLVLAITRYTAMAHQLRADLTAGGMGLMTGQANHKFIRQALADAEKAMALVDGDLEVAARVRDLALEQCLACWERDWNGDGRVDDSDRRFLEVELDAQGQPYPEGDPRRRPTFRFDVGDVHWARAMIAFQRAVIDLVLAYRWEALDSFIRSMFSSGEPERLVLPLGDPARVQAARGLLLLALDEAEQARQDYLGETDDDREWVPNPRQQSHPMPLPVDEKLYETWRLVVGDLQRLLRSQEGIDVAEAAQLGDHTWTDPPRGFIDVGRLLSDPGDIVLDFAAVERMEKDRSRPSAEAFLKSFFRAAYVPAMKPSPLLSRMTRMRAEVERGEESLERKLRYLLWLN